MRLRHIPGAEESVEHSVYVVSQPEEKKGRWVQYFGNERPIFIEIGMGKGKFLLESARKNPEINYIGIERYSTIMLKALQKQEEQRLSNICFLRVDAEYLADIFEKEEVKRIYLNFSDPWPKDRHSKRRLTSPRFLAVYDQILDKNGRVEFKTDNRALFEYSLEAIPGSGWRIDWYTFDLYHSSYADGNVMTEYEAKFANMGKSICKLAASRLPKA